MSSDPATQPELDLPFQTFTRLCADKGLLNRPQGIEKNDRCDGLSDYPTLSRFLIARKNDPDAALKQLQQSVDFRQDRDILRLYDVVDTEDFEQARQFVRSRSGYPIADDWLGI